MADDSYNPLDYPTPASQYALYDMVDKDHAMVYFDKLTGGEQTISMVKYNITDGKGNVTTKFIPGQTSFAPMVLLRAMDKYSESMNDLFMECVAGKLAEVRKNYSVSMNDSQGNALVWWHLFNALPSAISGFNFNAPREAYYTDFEITMQAESIVIEF